MFVVKEINTRFGTLYQKNLVPNTTVLIKGAIGFNNKSDSTNKHYFIVMNQDGKLIYDACKYLNVTISNAGFKSREKVYSALKLLYSYCLIFDVEISPDNFRNENLNKFLLFLHGGETKGNYISVELNSRRKETVLGYLRIYHNYFNVLFEMENSPFSDFYNFNFNNTTQKYSRHTSINEMIPMYFKENELDKILEIVQQKYSVREHLIIHLMYKYGLRIGEVLGLTLEDIHVESKLNKIYLRNRVSDKQWQLSKSLLTPNSRSDYRRDIFKEYGSGFQIVSIDKETIDMIDIYLENSRTSIQLMKSEAKIKNLNEYCNADALDSHNFEGFNQYMFISSNLYKPLTSVGWNFVLRKILKQADIKIDKARRSSNLNHKFRHSFAMYWVKKGLDPNQLARKLRHKDVKSTYKYYNPDDQDQYELFLKYKDSIGERYNFEL